MSIIQLSTHTYSQDLHAFNYLNLKIAYIELVKNCPQQNTDPLNNNITENSL